MARLTAIELGEDCCTLVRGNLRGDRLSVSAVDSVDPAAFPGPGGFAATLKQTRRRLRLPRRARVVIWGLPEGATPKDPTAQPLLLPLQDAGFRIDRIVSPVNALGALARLRKPRADGAIAWLAVNRTGVAIVVVRPGALLYSNTFSWDSSVGALGSQAHLLHRYSLVAFLAPEVRRAIEAVKMKDARVDALVTCGNLPDLRSLTMPLIEELDLEVETLDSFDGLDVAPALKDRSGELAPVIRLACAGAIARPGRIRGAIVPARSRRWIAGAAMLAVAAAAAGWVWYGRQASPGTTAPPRSPRAVQRPPAPTSTVPPTSSSRTTTTIVRQPAPAAAATATPHPVTPRSRPAPSTTSVPPTRTPPVALPAPASPSGRTPPPVKPATPTTAPATVPPRPVTPAPATDRPAQAEPAPERLPDPLPNVTTILVSADRRFAMINGRVVSVGDAVGPRVVTAIDARSVVLREPSGLQIRVGLGGRMLGVERGGRRPSPRPVPESGLS